MERQFVESDMILSIGYEIPTSTLEIEFKNGGAVWQYYDVPENIYFELMAADSKGRYFHRNILRQYPENRVG
jgi:hypothetical protein